MPSSLLSALLLLLAGRPVSVDADIFSDCAADRDMTCPCVPMYTTNRNYNGKCQNLGNGKWRPHDCGRDDTCMTLKNAADCSGGSTSCTCNTTTTACSNMMCCSNKTTTYLDGRGRRQSGSSQCCWQNANAGTIYSTNWLWWIAGGFTLWWILVAGLMFLCEYKEFEMSVSPSPPHAAVL